MNVLKINLSTFYLAQKSDFGNNEYGNMERPAHDGDDPTSAPPAPAVLRVSVVNAMDGMQYDVDLSSRYAWRAIRMRRLTLPARATGNVLRQDLLVATGIPTDEQILLYGPPYTRLDPKKTIESYQFHTSQVRRGRTSWQRQANSVGRSLSLSTTGARFHKRRWPWHRLCCSRSITKVRRLRLESSRSRHRLQYHHSPRRRRRPRGPCTSRRARF